MNDDKQYPISEIFTSWQGEGLWSGTRMTFIRFAGCNVGKPLKGIEKNSTYNNEIVEKLKDTKTYGIIPIWQEECTSWDGRKFLCDTDFRLKEKLTAKEILDRVPKGVDHIVLTGGEPLIHDIEPLMQYTTKSIHIETSGTKLFPIGLPIWDQVWITVSPKKDCLVEMIARANEIKLLVDKEFDEQKTEKILWNINEEKCIVWLSSINGIDSLDKANMDKCKEIAERHPTWRITQQSHKIWGAR